MQDTNTATLDALDLTAEIVSAFVSNNSLPPSELPALLVKVHAVVAGLSNGGGTPNASVEPETAKVTPAQIRKSITPDALISFLDGKPYKSLKRHLGANGFDFASYRDRYGLPSDYPSVAPSYSASRSALAKSLGLGQGRARAAVEAAPSEAIVTDKPKRGRPAKKAA